MTRSEFVEKHRHEWEGWVLDAAMSDRSGTALSLWIKRLQSRIVRDLEAAYDELCPELPLPVVPEPANRIAGPMQASLRAPNGTNGTKR